MTEKKKKRMVGVIAATGILTFAILLAFAASGSGGGAAIERNVEGSEALTVTATSSTVTPSINYQGRLTDSAGEPLSGTYEMTFKLYEVASGGTALDTDTHSVEVTYGLFNTHIDFDQSYFDGRALWLGITVGTDSEMTPRQELRPVPYALSLRPGAEINGSGISTLTVKSANPNGRAIRCYADATSGTNFGVVGASGSPDGYGGYFYNDEGGIGVYGRGGYGGYFEAADEYGRGVYGSAVGSNGVGVYGKSIHNIGIFGESTAAAHSGVYGHNTDGVGVRGRSENNTGVVGWTGASDKYTSGVFGWSDKNGRGVVGRSDNNDGVVGWTGASDKSGVFGHSDTGIGVTGRGGKYGGYFATNQAGTWDDHTAGVSVLTTYNYSDGVYASTTGDYSEGVYASTTGDSSDGVYASTTGDNSDGVDVSTTGYGSEGVIVYTTGDDSAGVYAFTTGHSSEGVHAHTTGYGSEGVYAHTTGYSSEGVFVYTTGDSSEGVYAHTTGYGSAGVIASSREYYAIYAYGNIYVSGKIDVVGTVDPIIVECFNADPAMDYEVGDVVTLNEDSPYVKPCTEAYDTKVVGVVGPTLDIEDGEISVVIMGYRGARPDEEHLMVLENRLERAEARATAVELSESEDANGKENLEREIAMLKSEIEEAKSITRQVVKVKADASYAPIKRGDLLTTSSTEGHAMKAQPVDIGGVEIYRPGTIIGKAIEPLESGTGLIEVFVILQ